VLRADAIKYQLVDEINDLDEQIIAEKPITPVLRQNYPNPFNPITNIEFSISNSAFVTLDVYNVTGQKVKRLIGQRLKAGAHQIRFEGSDLPSGVYYYRLVAGEFSQVRKMILLR